MQPTQNAARVIQGATDTERIDALTSLELGSFIFGLVSRFCFPRYYHKPRRPLMHRKVSPNDCNPSRSDFNRGLFKRKLGGRLYHILNTMRY